MEERGVQRTEQTASSESFVFAGCSGFDDQLWEGATTEMGCKLRCPVRRLWSEQAAAGSRVGGECGRWSQRCVMVDAMERQKPGGGDGRWTVDGGRWTVGDGRWTMDDGRCSGMAVSEVLG